MYSLLLSYNTQPPSSHHQSTIFKEVRKRVETTEITLTNSNLTSLGEKVSTSLMASGTCLGGTGTSSSRRFVSGRLPLFAGGQLDRK